jgi:uncharacterized DUF497 family protein
MFLWDPAKAIINFEKHEVSFEEAATVFADPDALDWKDEKHSEEETRFKRLGKSVLNKIVLVVYTYRRTEDEKEAIRIISARQANRKEREAYSR